MAQLGLVTIPLDELRVGATCSHPIEDDEGILLLGARSRISQQIIASLRERGIDTIDVHPKDARTPATSKRDTPKKTCSKGPSPSCINKWEPSRPLKDILVDRHDEDLSEERTERLKRGMATAKDSFEQLKGLFAAEAVHSSDAFHSVSDGYARAMVDDYDQTVGIIGGSSVLTDLAERSVRMAVLGMAVAIEMALDGPLTLEVGMVGLLHDVGIYAMDPRFSHATVKLSDAELWDFHKHPLISGNCLHESMEVPYSVQVAVQQVHEQFDGSGYPRGLKGQRIHPYARILNVVDTYLTLTSPAANRPAIVPHDALGLMLFQASRGLFDPQVMRAFVNAETMFPLGSTVEMNNGELANVIRRPKDGYAAPVLKDSDGQLIDLDESQLRIARPVCETHLYQIRLTQREMQEASWCPRQHCFLVR